MGKIVVADDILAPSDTLKIRFTGKNPFNSTVVIPSMLRYILKVSAKDILETDIRWDVMAAPKKDFYGRWLGKRAEDAWTKTMIRVLIQGQQDSTDKTGWCKIELKGTINTVFEYTNFLQRALWWIYNYTFYYKQRRKYVEEGKDLIFQMKEYLQRTLGITPPEEAFQ
jgi:hypothetical protein